MKIIILALALSFVLLVLNERFVGGVEVYHIPPDTHHFVAIREDGLKKNAWYHFSTDKIDFESIRGELGESLIAISDLADRYDLRAGLKDKETGEMVYMVMLMVIPGCVMLLLKMQKSCM